MRPSRALKTLLWVNELRETRAQEDFARGQKELEELRSLLEEVSRRPRRLCEEMTRRTVSGDELRRFGFELSRSLLEKQELERSLEQRQRAVEELRQKLLEAHQKRRVAETLYQRARRAWLRELAEAEMKEIEDLVLTRRKDDEGL